MVDEVDLLELFSKNGDLVEDITYSDSRVLVRNNPAEPLTFRTTIFDSIMTYTPNYDIIDRIDEVAYGVEWV